MQPGKAKSVGAIIDAAVRGKLSRARALRLCKENPDVVTLALLPVGQRIAELEGENNGQQPSPSTPSGRVPLYTKPNTPKRRKKPGAKSGHQGVRRERPVRIDQHKTQRLTCCPHCRGKLQRCERSRMRITEDSPEVIEPAVILRKNGESNRSDRGAATQAILISVYQTLKLRSLNPTDTVTQALRSYVATGQLPPLPIPNIANG